MWTRAVIPPTARRLRQLPPGMVLAAMALGATLFIAPRAGAEAILAGAAPRGFFGWEAIGGYERLLPVRRETGPIDFPLRVEGHFSTRRSVTSIALSTYGTVRFRVPGFDRADFKPYLATGPGLHFQGSWSDLGPFADTLVEGDTVLKWHVFAGATLVKGERADLFTEARYTKPSRHDFDYLAFGIRIRSAGGTPR